MIAVQYADRRADIAPADAQESGDATAEDLYRLGLSFSTGQGAPLDYVQAHKWFNLAAMMGSAAAKEYRKEVAEHMASSEIAAAQRLAREWLAERPKAA